MDGFPQKQFTEQDALNEKEYKEELLLILSFILRPFWSVYFIPTRPYSLASVSFTRLLFLLREIILSNSGRRVLFKPRK